MKKFALLICMWMALIVPGHFIANAQPTNISVINTGAANNDKTGDTLRIAFGKINTNFYYLTNLVRTITNSIVQAEVTNAVQQTALAGLTNTINNLVTNILYGTATLDFPSTAAGTSSDLTITVTNAATGNVVSVGALSATLSTNTSYYGFVSAANTVTVRFCNFNLSTAVNPASGTFKVMVTKF